MIRWISYDEIITFHGMLIDRTGGSHGVRDISLIESAIAKANATFDGVDLYPGRIEKIAAITFALINNHGFVDGNKRIGIAVMELLLLYNKISYKANDEELIELGLGIAAGRVDECGLREWLENHIK